MMRRWMLDIEGADAAAIEEVFEAVWDYIDNDLGESHEIPAGVNIRAVEIAHNED